ncbi:MAG: MBOAT family protein [Rhodospirillaceae bacterium]|jgi:D-alanyl-lipoteichoic acid acyltransferase DltB (MBOAT superfamily)|nr:MBOAT family protein [Rhodospirillaceae bacterium]
MLFTDARFAIFFVLCFAVYWLLSRNAHRHHFLLVMSYVFYAAWDYRFLALIIYASAVAFIAAKLISASDDVGRRRKILFVAVGLELASLFFFKYFGFVFENISAFSGVLFQTPDWSIPDILLPVGISFFTFQAISYIVDVARGDTRPSSNPLDVALYIAFFPQLVAGPIVRSTDFMPQLAEQKVLNWDGFIQGAAVFLLGFCYKAAIADNLALVVDPVYGAPEDWSRLSLWVATLAFHSQIYFDFAGYSWMAIGVALMLGFKLPANFNYPYIARNIRDFWQRWHISLSTWLRDYLYIPLGGSRHGGGRFVFAAMVTMILGGIWHGASWNFVLWGLLHGVAILAYRYRALIPGFGARRRGSPLIGLIFGVAITQVWVLLLWIPFRADTFADTTYIVSAMFGGSTANGEKGYPVWMLLMVVLPVLVDAAAGLKVDKLRAMRPGTPFVYGLVAGAAFALMLVLLPLDSSPFIYFRF